MTQRGLIRYLRFAVLDQTEHARAPRRKPRRGPARSWKYLAWIRTMPSIVSGLYGCEAAHTGDDGGMRMKASDFSCLPLTPAEHREYHQLSRERFEAKHGIDCRQLVRQFNELWFSQEAR
jgi:hypothetical protein